MQKNMLIMWTISLIYIYTPIKFTCRYCGNFGDANFMERKARLMKRAEVEGKTYLMAYEEFRVDNKLKNLSEDTIKSHKRRLLIF